MTAAHLAAQHGHMAVIEALARSGAELSRPANDGATAAFSAAHRGHLGILQMLVDCGADVNARWTRASDGATFTALEAARISQRWAVTATLEMALGPCLLVGARQRLCWSGAVQRRVGRRGCASCLSHDLAELVAIKLGAICGRRARIAITSRWQWEVAFASAR